MEINLNMGVFNALEDNEMIEIGGGLLGGVGGGLAYAATCWWGD